MLRGCLSLWFAVLLAVPAWAHSGCDGLFLKEGKVMVLKGGKVAALDKEIVLDNGSKVTADGTVTSAKGQKTSLKEGLCMTMAGETRSKEACMKAGKKAAMKECPMTQPGKAGKSGKSSCCMNEGGQMTKK